MNCKKVQFLKQTIPFYYQSRYTNEGKQKQNQKIQKYTKKKKNNHNLFPKKKLVFFSSDGKSPLFA